MNTPFRKQCQIKVTSRRTFLFPHLGDKMNFSQIGFSLQASGLPPPFRILAEFVDQPPPVDSLQDLALVVIPVVEK